MVIGPRSNEELLHDVPVLKDLSTPLVKILADAADVRRVLRAAPLFSEGQVAEGLFVVRTGEVKLTRSAKDGREQILYLARPGRPILDGVRFDGGTYAAAAVAMREATALLVTNATLSSTGQAHPELLRALVDLRARRADRYLSLVGDLSLRTVPARLASFLCTLLAARRERGEDTTSLVRDLTTETVAGRLGTVREEISRGLAYLEREGALSVSPDLIEIRDASRLEAIAFGIYRKNHE